MLSKSFKKLTDFIRRFAQSPYAGLWLFLYSIVQSILIPIPVDVLLIPLAIGNRQKAFLMATIGAIGSTIGGIIGYGIGYLAFQTVAVPVLHWFCQFIPTACPEIILPGLQNLFAQYGIGVVALSSIAPLIPYRFTILAAGLGHMPLIPFILVSFVVHWVRYLFVSWLAMRYGRTALRYINKRVSVGVAIAAMIALAIYFIIQ